MPFTPIGDQARWRTLYTLLRQHAPGETVTYAELASATDLDPARDRGRLHAAMVRAQDELLAEDHKCVSVIRNHGYRLTHADERATLVRREQHKALRRIEAGHAKATHVDLDDIADPEARRALEQVGRAMAMQLDFNRRIIKRQERIEEVVESVQHRTKRTDQELDELRERIARLEDA